MNDAIVRPRPVPKWCWRMPIIVALPMLLTAGRQSVAQDTTKDDPQQQNDSDAAAPDLKRGLVGHYRFEDSAQDESGQGNHGTPHGLVEYRPGKIGNAVHFQGQEDRGFITIPNSESLKFDEATTFACWFYITDDSGQTGQNSSGGTVPKAHQVIVSKHGDRAGFTLLTLAETCPFRQLSMIGMNGSPDEVGITFPPDEPLKRWHHVATVADNSGLRLYLNGVLIGATRTKLKFDIANQCDVFVGINGPVGRPSNPEGFLWFPLNGAVDDLRIYNRGLSHNEVRSLAGVNADEDNNLPLINAEELTAFSPEQATGVPDTPNLHADARMAWASQTPDDQPEWLMLEYSHPVQPKAVLVYESSYGGAVNKVSVFDPEGAEVEVWSGSTVRTGLIGPPFPSLLPVNVPFETSRVKVYIDSPRFKGWNQIDAVGLRDNSAQIHWAIKATASSTRVAETEPTTPDENN